MGVVGSHARALRLQPSSLCRLQRVHRHGQRHGGPPRHHLAGEFPLSVPRHFAVRLLAAVAHHLVTVVERLRLHPLGRKSTLQRAVRALGGVHAGQRHGVVGRIGRRAPACGRHLASCGWRLDGSPRARQIGHRRQRDDRHAPRRLVAWCARELRDVGRAERRRACALDCVAASRSGLVGQTVGLAHHLPHSGAGAHLVSGRFPHCMERVHRSTPPGKRVGDRASALAPVGTGRAQSHGPGVVPHLRSGHRTSRPRLRIAPHA